LALVTVCAAACGSSGPAIPTRVTVHGRIFDPGSGAPIPNAFVQAGSIVTASGADGRFVAAGVDVPYDLVVGSSSGHGGVVFVFSGVTRDDPVVAFLGSPAALRQGTVSLTLSGAAGTDVATTAWAGDAPSAGFLGSQSSSSQIDTDLIWYGPETTRGIARVLTYSTASRGLGGLPISYGGFGTLTTMVSSTDGSPPGGGAVVLSQVPTLSLTSTTEVPESYVPFFRTLSIVFSDGAGLSLGGESWDGGTAVTDLVPVLPDSSIQIDAFAASENPGGGGSTASWIGSPSGSPVLRFARPPTLVEPVDGADVPADVALSWGNSTPGVSTVNIGCWSPDQPFVLLMVLATTGTSLRLPDLRALGMALPPGADCSWAVGQWSPPGDIDSYLSEPGNRGTPTARTWSGSDARHFNPR
jgi:hypothetical protein